MPRSDRSLSGAHDALKMTPKRLKPYKAPPTKFDWVMGFVGLICLVGFFTITSVIWWPIVRSWLGGV